MDNSAPIPDPQGSTYRSYFGVRTSGATSAFTPDLPLNQEWTDTKLYKRYGLTKDEIAFIESQVAEHDSDLFEEAEADPADE